MNYVYQYKDHLGNIRLSYTDNNNDGVITASTEIIEEKNYYPFGLQHKGYNNDRSSIGNSKAEMFSFGGKELNEELGLEWHDFHARNYDASLGRWMNIDPLAEDYYEWSPYNFVYNSPLKFIDPTGMGPETTIVKDIGDGKYEVTAWVDDGKTDVVLEDGTKIGESLTTHSFVDAKNNAVEGAIIDTNSTEGQDFIDDEIIEGDPNLFDYKDNAKLNQDYDFKSRNLNNESTDKEALVHRTRGSMTSDGKMASARDFGNMAAGIVATRNGVPKPVAIYKFEQLQGGKEPPVSSKAQEIGFKKGFEIKKQDAQKFRAWRESVKTCRGCN
ncbi:hypothetical protein T190820D02B_60001 [Tenacibaculum sp. 190524A05c]